MVGRSPAPGVSRARPGDPRGSEIEGGEAENGDAEGGDAEGGTLFFLGAPAASGETVELPRDEAHHATRVLRLPGGAVVGATDGIGGRYRLRLLRRGPAVLGEVLQAERLAAERPAIEVGLGAGRRERFLWAVEKLTELAVAAIVPLLSEAVQGRRGRAARGTGLDARARARAAAALKQSLGSHLPRIEPPVDARGWASRSFDGLSLLLSFPAAGVAPLAAVILAEIRAEPGLAARGVRLAVGPEGGFLADEERTLAASGFRPAHLGARRLRFETAAVAAAATVRAVVATEGIAWSS
jgi:16S rRNA (uracil1498-N3)-methyltransferase